MLAVLFAGCGSSSPANSGKGGHDGGSDAATGSAGAGGSTGAAGDTGGGGSTGAAGDTGAAGAPAGSGGSTIGAGGSVAGTGGGTAGSAGATAGTSGNAGAGGGTAGTGAAGAKADGGTDAAVTPCQAGAMCADGFTCTNARACGPNREEFCYCDPMGKVACEACSTADAGTGNDAGAGLKMCPANVMNRNATCTMNGERCAASACTNKQQDVCICAVFGASATGNWFCTSLACQ
jgi:hypothetical protein